MESLALVEMNLGCVKLKNKASHHNNQILVCFLLVSIPNHLP